MAITDSAEGKTELYLFLRFHQGSSEAPKPKSNIRSEDFLRQPIAHLILSHVNTYIYKLCFRFILCLN